MKFINSLNIEKYLKSIIVLGLAYASVIIFPAFGPVLLMLTSPKEVIFLSIIALIFLSIGFLLPPGIFISSFKSKNTIVGLAIASFSTIVIGFYNAIIIKCVVIVLIVFTAGRIVCFWSRDYFIGIELKMKGKVIGYSLFIAYGILYICNVIIPALPEFVALLLSPILLLVSSILLQYLSENDENTGIKQENKVVQSKIGFMCFLAFCIYITAGITYGGVYPTLVEFKYIDRYYNVFPFLIVASFAGHLADTKGRKYLLYVGLSLLGISFAFFAVTINPITYLIIQTAIQSAWAFLDIYIWVVFADIAFNRQKSIIYTLGLSSIMVGVSVGASISYIFSQISVPNLLLFTFVAHLPLFFAVSLLHRVPETLSYEVDNVHEENTKLEIVEQVSNTLIETVLEPNMVSPVIGSVVLEQLTPREKEVFNLLIWGKENSEISEDLHISNNTVKTHVRNIYRKLEVGSRKELKSLVRD